MDVAVADVAAERLQPAVEDAVVRLDVADGKPDAGEPVCDEDEHDEQESEHGGAVFDVQVELACDPRQPQQAHHLERTELRTDALRIQRLRDTITLLNETLRSIAETTVVVSHLYLR